MPLGNIGANVLPSGANFLLCSFGRDMTEAVRYLRNKHILVRECASFGLDADRLRFAVRTEEENELLAGELGKWLRS